jgi:hypothetical protein
MIDDLPDLNNVHVESRYDKFISNRHFPPKESGMGSLTNGHSNIHTNDSKGEGTRRNNNYSDIYLAHNTSDREIRDKNDEVSESYLDYEDSIPTPRRAEHAASIHMRREHVPERIPDIDDRVQAHVEYFENDIKKEGDVTCADVLKHIDVCRLCSSYHSPSITPYIIIIVILAVLCILLLKKHLNI